MQPRSLLSGLALAATFAALAPGAALAHVGAGETSGIIHGFAHPIGGLDHMLAMVAVGMFAAHLGGRAPWAVPLTFVAMMGLGGWLGVARVDIPYVEIAIALSVAVLGLLVAVRAEWPVATAMLLVGVFAVFHGHAHGAEMPMDASGAAYAAGFMLATALLHVAGLALGVGMQFAGASFGKRAAQGCGSAIALAGVALLAGVL